MRGMSSLAPLEALAKQRLSDLWETTLALLEQGKEEDERDNSAAAYLQYSEAIGGLQALLEQEADARRQELLRARLVEYSVRLQQLAALRQEAREAAAPAFPTAPSQSPPVQQQLSGGLTIQASSAASPAAKPLASARLATEQAVQADEAGDSTEALELYTIAIEAFFEAIKLEPAAEHRTLMAGLLDRAEQLKLSAATGAVAATRPAAAPAAAPAPAAASPPAAARPVAPPAGQGFTEEEKAVLTRSSTINGRRYYPWLDDAARERFSYASAWSDPDGLLALNAEQRSHFGGWARPSEVMRGAHLPLPHQKHLVSSPTLTLALTIALSFALRFALRFALGRRAQDDLSGLFAHDHTDDHHRLLLRLVTRHRRSIRAQVPQATHHQDYLPAGPRTHTHCICALHMCTAYVHCMSGAHCISPPRPSARRTGTVYPSTTRQASTWSSSPSTASHAR